MRKEIIGPHYTKEECAIFEKYKKYAGGADVYSIHIECWKAFEELEKIRGTYMELFCNHFEDLKYYALMYHDVTLFYDINLLDMAFFAQRKNKIIGYKNKILSTNSLKSEVIQIYYQLGGKFINFCAKHLGITWNRLAISIRYQYSTYLRIKEQDFQKRFGVYMLSEEQCEIIVLYKNEIDKYSPYVQSRLIRGERLIEGTSIRQKPNSLNQNICGWINSCKSYSKIKWEEERIERERKAELERLEYERRMEKYRFNKRNFHERDKNITFRQIDHVYIVNGIALDSVTTFVNNAFPKFNSEFHAKRKAKQLGISPEEVLEMWNKKGKESRDLGTAMHSKIENYYLGSDSVETDAYKLFKIFANKIELKPYRTEWAVYDWEHKIAGTIDFVDYQNGEYIIYDWKRSEKIIDNGIPVKIYKYGEKGNYPLEHLDNTPYYHYALQLSLYKYILEKNYGMKISDLRLGIFHPTYNKPYVLKMPYLKKEINDIFNLRSEVIF